MAQDALMVLQASTTVVATLNGTGITIPYGTPRTGLNARINYSAMSAATGTITATFSIDHASDATNYVPLASSQPIKASATAVSGEVHLPFITPMAGVNSSTDAIRLTCTITGASTTPTITYLSAIENSMP